MNQVIIEQVSSTLQISVQQINTVLEMLSEGNTVPFIARYRKEQTKGLDEEQIREINKVYEYNVSLQKRKEDVIRLIDEKGMLTEELQTQILACEKLTDIEDIYRPFKEKKKTRATEAKRKGLEGLAIILLRDSSNPKKEAEAFLNEEVETVDDALQGAMDIIAELVADEPKYRKFIKQSYEQDAKITSKLVKKNEEQDEKRVFEQYYEYSESIKHIPPHRILAMNRGENEKILKVSLAEDADYIVSLVKSDYVKQTNESKKYIEKAVEDAYKRLIKPSIDREIRSELTVKAEEHAIELFSENLGQLLLTPPMKNKRVLGVDPAYRTGCKLSVLDETQKVLEIGVIYPHQKYVGENVPERRVTEAKQKVLKMIKDHKVDLVAIGNGTASRETEQFIADVLDEAKLDTSYVIVSEAGASVYSASDLARKEFPDFEVEERSAVSIGRRLQDPLSELVKIDPKSIGVGQYQHDVDQKALREKLGFVVETVVNSVGVNLNTASSSLLQYVSGVSSKIAENIVSFRDDFGKYKNRSTLLKVSGLGPKAYEQAVGFLRIIDGDEALDQTAIHPESYDTARALLKLFECTEADLGTDTLKNKVKTADHEMLKEALNVDEYTLEDILDAFEAPLRDPRDEYDAPILKKSVLKLEHLTPGMELMGTVRNVVDFGAFVDCGVKVDGLVHISKITNKYIKHPSEVLQVGQVVTVWVVDVDIKRQRLALTMRQDKMK